MVCGSMQQSLTRQKNRIPLGSVVPEGVLKVCVHGACGLAAKALL